MKNWIDLKSNLSVTMPDSVWQEMACLSEESYPNECGGILIGKYTDDLKQAKVKKIMVSKNNSGTRMFFLREAKEANNFLKKLWHMASGAKYFIGEWHSHPDGTGYPSAMDDDSMFRIAKRKKCACKRPVLIILNGKSNIWQSDRCWVYSPEGIRCELLSKFR